MENEQKNDGKQINNRLGLCEVCRSVFAKYKCPRCEVCSCSLNCTKIHKLELECSGERDRTKFISLTKFTNFDLSSDLRLLEEIGRCVGVAKKRKLYRRPFLPRNKILLKNKSKSRGINLEFLPQHFSKHKENDSYVQDGTIFWHIEFVLGRNHTVRKQVNEDVVLKKVLGEILEESQYFEDISDLDVFLKNDYSKDQFYELDFDDEIRELLKGKKICEFPQIFIDQRSKRDEYELVPEAGDEKGNLCEKLIKNEENFAKNLMFNTV